MVTNTTMLTPISTSTSCHRRRATNCAKSGLQGAPRASAGAEGRLSTRRGRGLAFVVVRQGIDMRPARRRGGPDEALRPRLAVIERADAHHDELRSGGGLAEQRRAAGRAEAAAHRVAAIGRADMLGGLALQAHARDAEDRVHRRVAAGEVLAVPAPAGANGTRRVVEAEADRAAEASSGDWLRHVWPRDGGVGRYSRRSP